MSISCAQQRGSVAEAEEARVARAWTLVWARAQCGRGYIRTLTALHPPQLPPSPHPPPAVARGIDVPGARQRAPAAAALAQGLRGARSPWQPAKGHAPSY